MWISPKKKKQMRRLCPQNMSLKDCMKTENNWEDFQALHKWPTTTTMDGVAFDIYSMTPMQMLILIIMMILIAPPNAGKSDVKRRQILNRSGDWTCQDLCDDDASMVVLTWNVPETEEASTTTRSNAWRGKHLLYGRAIGRPHPADRQRHKVAILSGPSTRYWCSLKEGPWSNTIAAAAAAAHRGLHEDNAFLWRVCSPWNERAPRHRPRPA